MKEKCKNCTHPRKECIPYLMTLTTKEALEWCRMWKDRFGWSNATFAEKTNVPKGTVDRTLSHAKLGDDAAGLQFATIRPFICAIIGCTMEELEACEEQVDSNAASIIKENQRLEGENHDLKDDVARMKREAVNQRTFLANQIAIKDRYICVLGILLALALSVIIGALIIDKLNPALGFVWRTH